MVTSLKERRELAEHPELRELTELRQPGPITQRRGTAWLWAGAAVLVALLGFVIFSIINESPEPELAPQTGVEVQADVNMPRPWSYIPPELSDQAAEPVARPWSYIPPELSVEPVARPWSYIAPELSGQPAEPVARPWSYIPPELSDQAMDAQVRPWAQ